MTSLAASLSVSRRSPILADRLAASSSDPDLAGDRDGVLDEPPPLADERDGVAIRSSASVLHEHQVRDSAPDTRASQSLAVEIRSAVELHATLEEKTLA